MERNHDEVSKFSRLGDSWIEQEGKNTTELVNLLAVGGFVSIEKGSKEMP